MRIDTCLVIAVISVAILGCLVFPAIEAAGALVDARDVLINSLVVKGG